MEFGYRLMTTVRRGDFMAAGCSMDGGDLRKALRGFGRTTQPGALLASAYDPMYYLYTGRQAIPPALHRPATYFYPMVTLILGSVDEIKTQLVKLRVKCLVVDRSRRLVEGKATFK
jgi:hypothetical protein